MFSLGAGLYETYLVSREVSVLLVGCDNAGKTSLLERLKVTDFKNTTNTSAGWFSSSQDQVHFHRQQESAQQNTSTDIADPRCESDHWLVDRFQLLDPLGHFFSSAHNQHEKKFEGVSCATAMTNQSSLLGLLTLSSHSKELAAQQYDLIPGKQMLPSHLIRPTIGMNLTKLEAFGLRAKILDLSGSPTMRSLWNKHYSSIDAIVYVVDISKDCHLDKLYEARAFFLAMRDHLDDAAFDASSIPILIFFNKVDLHTSTYEPNVMNSCCSTSSHSSSTSTTSSATLHDEEEEDLSEPIHLHPSKCKYDDKVNLTKFSIYDIASIFLKPVNVPPTLEFKISLSSNVSPYSFISTQLQIKHDRGIQFIDYPLEDRYNSLNMLHDYTYTEATIKYPTLNPIMAITAGSAKTGEGVRLAFSWLFHAIKTTK